MNNVLTDKESTEAAITITS